MSVVVGAVLCPNCRRSQVLSVTRLYQTVKNNKLVRGCVCSQCKAVTMYSANVPGVEEALFPEGVKNCN